MSKKIFFIVLTCCLLVATFCVSFAGAPQVQHAPANVRAVLDRPDCTSAPLIVPPVVEPPLMDVVIPEDGFPAGTYRLTFDQQTASEVISNIFCYVGDLSIPSFVLIDTDYAPMLGFLGYTFQSLSFRITPNSDIVLSCTFELDDSTYTVEVAFSPYNDYYMIFNSSEPFYFTDGDDVRIESLPFDSLQPYVAPPTGVAITGDIIDILVSGLAALGNGVGSSFSVMSDSIFINVDGTGLSTFGILVVCFAAVSLGLSLTRWVLNFVTSWGNRNR